MFLFDTCQAKTLTTYFGIEVVDNSFLIKEENRHGLQPPWGRERLAVISPA